MKGLAGEQSRQIRSSVVAPLDLSSSIAFSASLLSSLLTAATVLLFLILTGGCLTSSILVWPDIPESVTMVSV